MQGVQSIAAMRCITCNDVLISDCQCMDRTIAVSYFADQVILARCRIPNVNYTMRTTVQPSLHIHKYQYTTIYNLHS